MGFARGDFMYFSEVKIEEIHFVSLGEEMEI